MSKCLTAHDVAIVDMTLVAYVAFQVIPTILQGPNSKLKKNRGMKIKNVNLQNLKFKIHFSIFFLSLSLILSNFPILPKLHQLHHITPALSFRLFPYYTKSTLSLQNYTNFPILPKLYQLLVFYKL